jgi:hypothetical protein
MWSTWVIRGKDMSAAQPGTEQRRPSRRITAARTFCHLAVE